MQTRVPLVDQATVPVTVRYLEWTEEQKKEWIREAARLVVEIFLDDEQQS